jgi:RNA polymerase sigma factor (sigma-70 family)
MTDQDLLQSFHAQQDQAAFHALLRRHGPMVLDVCRGALGNEADAEDAFQATFLILARKAGSIRRASSVGSWLHGVAYRTALKARAQSATRQKHEARAPAPKPAEPDDLSWRGVRQVLHEEVSRLPERYRAPLVLCYLEGATQDAAAVQLKLAKSTLRERLERGRALLRTRLMHRGLGPAAVLVAGAWPIANSSASMPASMVSSTVKAATLFAAGQTAAAGLISAKAAALTEGVLQSMFLNKMKTAMAVVLVVCFLLGGVFLVADPASVIGQTPAKEKEPPKSPTKVDSNWVGEWLREGDADRPCAIFQKGRVLLLVNEDGEFATGKIIEANKITTRWSQEDGLIGELVDKGKTISWANGTTWKRP